MVRPPDTTIFRGKCMTPRQREVLMQIGTGKTLKQIAAALKLSIKTVEAHKDRLKCRLGVSNSNQLLIAAFRYVDAMCPPHRQD